MNVSKDKAIKIGIATTVLLIPLLAFNNCQKLQSVGGDMMSSASLTQASTKEEEALVVLLNKAAERSGKMGLLSEQVKEKSQSETDSKKLADYARFQVDLGSAAKALDDVKAEILHMLTVQRLSISSNEVLKSVDYLVLALSEARSMELEVELRAEIGRVEQESKARDANLANQINNLENEFAAFKADVKRFQDQVNSKFKSLDDQIAQTQSRLNLINTLLNDHIASSQAADAALKLALGDLKTFTETQIVRLTEQNSKLKEDILAQKSLLNELFQSQEGVGTLAGRLCTTNAQGQISDSRAKCTGSEANLYTSATCCLTVDAVNCGVLFPSEVQVTARNQCNILIATIKNHDEQLKAIREVDEKQTTLISGLLEDVTSLTQQVSILADGYKLLADAVNAISAKLTNIDARLVIVEFKAARSEAAATIEERAELNLAWIARRTADVSDRFCTAQVHQALNQFDYEAARQSWHYCKERLEFLTQAKELTQLAKAYTQGLLSVNVDTSCSAIINGKNAEDLTNSELLNESIFKAVQAQCTTGGAVVARAMMLNVVQLLGAVGPDFRTVQYMNKKAKIGQLLFFGKPISETTAAERAAFELVDPTDPAISKTLYARVERAFVKRYVETRMRTVAGTFPERPSDMPASISGFNQARTVAQIKADTSDFGRRLASLELEESCSDCGFAVEGRTVTDVVVSRNHKERFSYPKDIESLCPIINDVVVLKNNDGRFYPYVLNYDWMREDLKPYLFGGVHHQIAASQADVNAGNFSYVSPSRDFIIDRNGLGVAKLKSRLVLTLTQPYASTYAGRGACLHSALTYSLKDQEWIAPSGAVDLLSYLNNYATATVTAKCKTQMGSSSVARTRVLESAYQNRMWSYAGIANQDSINLVHKVSENTTQLTGKYWTLKDKVLSYGVNNQSVSISQPFFGSTQSHTDQFVRALRTVAGTIQVQECTPNEPI